MWKWLNELWWCNLIEMQLMWEILCNSNISNALTINMHNWAGIIAHFVHIYTSKYEHTSTFIVCTNVHGFNEVMRVCICVCAWTQVQNRRTTFSDQTTISTTTATATRTRIFFIALAILFVFTQFNLWNALSKLLLLRIFLLAQSLLAVQITFYRYSANGIEP